MLSGENPTSGRKKLIHGVLVDMDGTTVDSNAMVEDSWRELCEEHGFDLEELLVFSHGRVAIETVAHYLPHLTSEQHWAYVNRMREREAACVHLVNPIKGAPEFLHRLDALGVPWALVTSANRSLAEQRYHYSGLPWPKVNVTSEDVTEGKPNPAPYLMAAEALGIDPAETVVFEDAPPGMQSGINAGAAVIAVGGGPLTGENDGETLSVFAEVPDFTQVQILPTVTPGLFELSVL